VGDPRIETPVAEAVWLSAPFVVYDDCEYGRQIFENGIANAAFLKFIKRI
jgi:hypothetical protein